MKVKHYSRIERQLSGLKAQLEIHFKNGASWSDSAVKSLVLKIKTLANKIVRAFSLKYAAQLLGAFSFILMSQNSQAQTFADGVENPFGLQIGQGLYLTSTCAVDLDGDGDLDIISSYYVEDSGDPNYGGAFSYFENTGTPEQAQFGAPVINPFGLTTLVESYIIFPEAADIDGDGDYDLLIGGSFSQDEPEYYLQGITYIENIGTATNPVFGNALINPFNLNPVTEGPFIMDVVDIDGDGDLDILGTSYENSVYGLAFFENTGSASNPDFADPVNNPTWFPNADPFNRFGDLDGDGDLDAVLIGFNSDTDFVEYAENIGTPTSPSFGTINGDVFNNNLDSDVFFPEVADMDGDGDLDVMGFVYYYDGETYGSTQVYYENLLISTSVSEVKTPLLEVYPNPSSDVIRFNASQQPEKITIENLQGQILYETTEVVSEINISEFSSGFYILNVHTSEGAVASKKWIKE